MGRTGFANVDGKIGGEAAEERRSGEGYRNDSYPSSLYAKGDDEERRVSMLD